MKLPRADRSAGTKSGNLQHIDHFARRCGLIAFVNVGGQGKMVARTHIGKLLQAAFQPRAAEGTERSAGWPLSNEALKIKCRCEGRWANFYQTVVPRGRAIRCFRSTQGPAIKRRLHAKVHNGLAAKVQKNFGESRFVLGEKSILTRGFLGDTFFF